MYEDWAELQRLRTLGSAASGQQGIAGRDSFHEERFVERTVGHSFIGTLDPFVPLGQRGRHRQIPRAPMTQLQYDEEPEEGEQAETEERSPEGDDGSGGELRRALGTKPMQGSRMNRRSQRRPSTATAPRLHQQTPDTDGEVGTEPGEGTDVEQSFPALTTEQTQVGSVSQSSEAPEHDGLQQESAERGQPQSGATRASGTQPKQHPPQEAFASAVVARHVGTTVASKGPPQRDSEQQRSPVGERPEQPQNRAFRQSPAERRTEGQGRQSDEAVPSTTSGRVGAHSSDHPETHTGGEGAPESTTGAQSESGERQGTDRIPSRVQQTDAKSPSHEQQTAAQSSSIAQWNGTARLSVAASSQTDAAESATGTTGPSPDSAPQGARQSEDSRAVPAERSAETDSRRDIVTDFAESVLRRSTGASVQSRSQQGGVGQQSVSQEKVKGVDGEARRESATAATGNPAQSGRQADTREPGRRAGGKRTAVQSQAQAVSVIPGLLQSSVARTAVGGGDVTGGWSSEQASNPADKKATGTRQSVKQSEPGGDDTDAVSRTAAEFEKTDVGKAQTSLGDDPHQQSARESPERRSSRRTSQMSPDSGQHRATAGGQQSQTAGDRTPHQPRDQSSHVASRQRGAASATQKNTEIGTETDTRRLQQGSTARASPAIAVLGTVQRHLARRERSDAGQIQRSPESQTRTDHSVNPGESGGNRVTPEQSKPSTAEVGTRTQPAADGSPGQSPTRSQSAQHPTDSKSTDRASVAGETSAVGTSSLQTGSFARRVQNRHLGAHGQSSQSGAPGFTGGPVPSANGGKRASRDAPQQAQTGQWAGGDTEQSASGSTGPVASKLAAGTNTVGSRQSPAGEMASGSDTPTVPAGTSSDATGTGTTLETSGAGTDIRTLVRPLQTTLIGQAVSSELGSSPDSSRTVDATHGGTVLHTTGDQRAIGSERRTGGETNHQQSADVVTASESGDHRVQRETVSQSPTIFSTQEQASAETAPTGRVDSHREQSETRESGLRGMGGNRTHGAPAQHDSRQRPADNRDWRGGQAESTAPAAEAGRSGTGNQLQRRERESQQSAAPVPASARKLGANTGTSAGSVSLGRTIAERHSGTVSRIGTVVETVTGQSVHGHSSGRQVDTAVQTVQSGTRNTSERNADTSERNADTSERNADTSERNADTSEATAERTERTAMGEKTENTAVEQKTETTSPTDSGRQSAETMGQSLTMLSPRTRNRLASVSPEDGAGKRQNRTDSGATGEGGDVPLAPTSGRDAGGLPVSRTVQKAISRPLSPGQAVETATASEATIGTQTGERVPESNSGGSAGRSDGDGQSFTHVRSVPRNRTGDQPETQGTADGQASQSSQTPAGGTGQQSGQTGQPTQNSQRERSQFPAESQRNASGNTHRQGMETNAGARPGAGMEPGGQGSGSYPGASDEPRRRRQSSGDSSVDAIEALLESDAAIDRLVEKLHSRIERKRQIERERRGL